MGMKSQMKLTHNAVSMLLSAYRAIFQRAYTKGLATAVLLTAGLATTAQAADPIGGNINAAKEITQSTTVNADLNVSGKGSLTVKGTSGALSGANYDLTLAGADNTLTLSGGASVTFDNIKAAGGIIATGNSNTLTANSIALRSKLEVQDNGALTINADNFTANTGASLINSGTLTLTGNYDLTAITSYTVDAGAKFNIGAESSSPETSVTVAGAALTGALTNNAQFEVNNNSALKVQAESIELTKTNFSSSDKNSALTIQSGGVLDMRDTAVTLKTTKNDGFNTGFSWGTGEIITGDLKFTPQKTAAHINIDYGTLTITGNFDSTVDSNRNLRAQGSSIETTRDATINFFNYGTEANTIEGVNSVTADSADFKNKSSDNKTHSFLNFSGAWELDDINVVAGKDGQVTLKTGTTLTGGDALHMNGNTSKWNLVYNIGKGNYGDVIIEQGASATFKQLEHAFRQKDINELIDDGLMSGNKFSSDAENNDDHGKLTVNGNLTITGNGTRESIASGLGVSQTNGVFLHDVYLYGAQIEIGAGGKLAFTGADAVEDIIVNAEDLKAKAEAGELGNITVGYVTKKIEDATGWNVNPLVWAKADNVTVAAGGTLALDLTTLGITELTAEQMQAIRADLMSKNSQGTIDFGAIKLDGLADLIETDKETGKTAITASDLASVGNIDGLNLDQLATATVTEVTSTTPLPGAVYGNLQATANTTSYNVKSNMTLVNDEGDGFGYSLKEDGSTELLDYSISTGNSLTVSNGGTVGDIAGQGEFVITNDTNKQTTTGALTVSKITTQGPVVAQEINNDELVVYDSLTSAPVSAEENAALHDITTGVLTVHQGASLTTNDLEIKGKDSLDQDKTSLITGSVTANSVTLNQGAVLQIGTDGSNSASGKLSATKVNLDGGTLIVDPEFNQATATAAIGAFTSQSVTTESADLVINGNVIVGKNSALGVGMSERELTAAIARYQTNGSLQAGNYGSILLVNDSGLTIENNYGIALGTADVATLQSKRQANAIYFGTGGSLVLTARSLSTEPTITFAGTNTNGNLIAGGGQLVVPAGASAAQIANTFVDAAGNAAKVQVDGTNTLYISSANNLYYDTLAAGETLADVDLKLNTRNARNILSGLSNATYAYALEVLDANAKLRADALNPDYVPGGTEPQYLKPMQGLDFVQDAVGVNAGSGLETAARLAGLAGAAQSAQQTMQATTDVIAARAGMGVMSNLVVSERNGFGLWFAPIYRMQDADGFEADGLDAGADIDLYGAALGADYAFMDSAKVGVMFNLGSGSADGNGAGSGVDNDFDYYSLAAYAAVTPISNLTLLADLSYSVADNDIEAESGVEGYGKLGTSLDSTALSLGVSAQYELNLAAVDITPHIGLRYTSLDVDDYSVDSDAGILAHSDSDRMSLFSIPVGVKFSRDFVSNNWTISPAFDLTLTGNMGDDELEAETTFVGAEGYEARLTTEVIDSFVYGAALGLSAENGNFNFGLGVSYQGSSNTDSVSVNAQAGYRF